VESRVVQMFAVDVDIRGAEISRTQKGVFLQGLKWCSEGISDLFVFLLSNPFLVHHFQRVVHIILSRVPSGLSATQAEPLSFT
jgi:hypothetical protein